MKEWLARKTAKRIGPFNRALRPTIKSHEPLTEKQLEAAKSKKFGGAAMVREFYDLFTDKDKK